MKRTTLQSRMKKLGIQRAEYRQTVPIYRHHREITY